MKQKITPSTAAHALGYPPGRKLLKVTSGPYANRQIALVQTAASEIIYTYADRPYSSWSAPVSVATDTADQPFDAIIASNGDIQVLYSEITTQNLVARQLDFSGGVWSVGPKITVYSGGPSLYPSLGWDSGDNLWVVWTLNSSGSLAIHVKSSTDGGSTWGSGPADAGTPLTGGASFAYARVLIDTRDIHVFYTEGGLTLARRSLPIAGGSWSTEQTIAAGSSVDQHFDAAVSADGRLGVVWNDSELHYREFDGAVWGAVTTIDGDGGLSSQLLFSGNIPIITYLSVFGVGQNLLMYSSRHTGSFSAPQALDSRARPFDGVLLYDAASAAFADLTSEATNGTSGDVYHPNTGVLLTGIGDALYLGLANSYRYLKILLSAAGAGGTVAYSYWNGSGWQAFTPNGGDYAFDLSDRELLLWEDYNALPPDWQKLSVNGDSRFWIKIETTSAFTTPPVGSQTTAVSDLTAISVRR